MSVAEPLLVLALLMVATQAWRGSRRRSAMNRALHEIRRPLQALALSAPRQAAMGGVQAGTVWQAISAVTELDRELNGSDRQDPCREPIACHLMADACMRRSQARAHLAGAHVNLCWVGPDALINGDGSGLAGAIENLLLNAIEHGGPEITLSGIVTASHLRIEVADSGRQMKGGWSVRHRFKGARHGHGLKVAERVAEDHGGRLETAFSGNGSKASLVFPLGGIDASVRSEIRVAG